MADEPKDLAPDPATLPGGASFDVDNASDADYKKHVKILERRKEMANLAPATPLVAVAAETAPAVASVPQPLDPIEAVHNVTGERRRFSETTWDLLGDDRQGWELAVAKPADL